MSQGRGNMRSAALHTRALFLIGWRHTKPLCVQRPPRRPNTGTQSLSGKGKRNVATRSSRSACGSPLFEAFPAIDGTPLSRIEGYSGLLATLRADRAGFHPPMALSIEQLASLGFAGLTAFGLVFEPLVCEEELFASRKNEFRSTVDALEDSIPVFHE